MEITVNGKLLRVVEKCTISQLLVDLDLPNTRIAVEVNRTVIARSTHDTFVLSAHDRVEIIHAVGGG